MHKSEAEMIRAAKVVGYEWRQLDWASSQYSEPWYAGAGTGGEHADESAVVELLLLHARVLRDFFTNTRPRPKHSESDILAEDFFDTHGHWTTPTFAYLAPNKVRLDRALAHLSYDRLDYETVGKEWNLIAVIKEITDAWEGFLTALPENRRDWFDYPEDESG